MKNIIKRTVLILLVLLLIGAAVLGIMYLVKQNKLNKARSLGNIQSFTYTESSDLAGKNIYTFNSADMTAVFDYNTLNGQAQKTAQQTWTSQELAEFSDLLAKADVPNWQEEYTSSNLVMDGTSWKVEIVYRDGTCVKSGGYASTPKEFDLLINAIKMYFPAIMVSEI